MFVLHSSSLESSNEMDNLLPSLESFNIPLKEVKKENQIQSCLDIYQSTFKFIPVSMLRHCKTAENVFRQLTETEEDEIHNIFVHLLAPFLFQQQTRLGNIKSLTNYILSSQNKSLLKPEEATQQQEAKLCELVEFIWKNVLDTFKLFNYPRTENWIQEVEKLNRCKEASEIIQTAKPLCQRIYGISNDYKVAISALVLITFYYGQSNGDVIFKLNKDINMKDPFEMPTGVVNKAQALELYDRIFKHNPFDYRMHAEIATIFLEQKLYSYAKWAAYRAILICPLYIDSYPVYIAARPDLSSKSEIIGRSLSFLADEIKCFQSDQYKDFSFLKEWTKYLKRESLANKSKSGNLKTADNDFAFKPHRENGAQNSLKDASSNGDENVGFQLKVQNSIEEKDKKVTSTVDKKSNVKKKKSEISSYKKLAREGSEAYCQSSKVVAIQKYEMALNMIATKSFSELSLSELDVVILKYCYAMSCISKHTKEDIKKGMSSLGEILDDHYLVSFPLAYYGQAVGLIAQNRYLEAKASLDKLVSIFERHIQIQTLFYPACEKVIEESNPVKLKEIVEGLMEKCRSPPPPVGTCFYQSDCPDHHIEIYYSDPDFLGFAHMICSDRCHLYFHYECWEKFKEINKLRRKKDWEDMMCKTPDCKGHLSKVEIIGADGIVRKEICTELKDKIEKEKTLMPPPQTPKSKKEIMKEVSKESMSTWPKRRRRSTSEHSDENKSVGENDKGAYSIADLNDVIPDLRVDGVPLSKKKLDLNDVSVPAKKATKNAVLKVLINNEFQTTDNERWEKLRQIKQGIYTGVKTENNGYNGEYFDVNLSPDSDVFDLSNDGTKTLKENVLVFLENFVYSKNSPIRTNDDSLIQELATYPLEAQAVIIENGGIEAFLKSSKKLYVSNNVIFKRQPVVDHIDMIISNQEESDRNSNTEMSQSDDGTDHDSKPVQHSTYLANISADLKHSDYINGLSSLLNNNDIYSSWESVMADSRSLSAKREDNIEDHKPQPKSTVELAVKKLLSLNSKDQSEIYKMIAAIAKKNYPKGYELTNEDVIFEDFCKNFENEYVVVTKSEVKQLALVDSLIRETEALKQQLELAQNNNLALRKENRELNSTRTAMLQGISSFLETHEQDKANIKTRIMLLHSEKDSLTEENMKLLELTKSIKKEMERRCEDSAKIIADQDKKYSSFVEEQKAIEEERDKLKMELQNVKRAFEIQMSRGWSNIDTQMKPPPIFPRLQGRPMFPYNTGHSFNPAFPRGIPNPLPSQDFMPIYPIGRIPPRFTSPMMENFPSSASTMPEKSAVRHVSEMDTASLCIQLPSPPPIDSEPLKKRFLLPTPDLPKNEETFGAQAVEESSSSGPSSPSIPPPGLSKRSGDSNGVGATNGMLLNLSSVYPSNKQFGAAKSYSSALSTTSSRSASQDAGLGKFWKIVQLVQPEFPTLKHDDFAGYLYVLRKENGSKLSGMRFRDIISKLKQVITSKKIIKDTIPKVSNNSSGSLRLGSFLEASCAWKNVPKSDSLLDSESEFADDICAICHETMRDGTHRLRCGHVHHLKCLEDWYKLQSTCPICREHCPLTCDYPPLS